MHSYYFTAERNHRAFYEVMGTNMKIHVVLKENDTKLILQNLINSPISSLSIADPNIIVTFANQIKVTFNEQLFEKISDIYEDSINKLKQKMKEYLEHKQLERFKGYIPVINRLKSKNLPKMFATAGLSATILLTSMATTHNLAKNMKSELASTPTPYNYETLAQSTNTDNIKLTDNATLKENEVIVSEPKPTNDMTELTTEEPSLNLSEPEETSKETSSPVKTEEIASPEASNLNEIININLEFNNRTGSGKVAETSKYLGDIIKYYANRYGLSDSLALAQISQECPNADASGYIKNPCQLTPYEDFIRSFKVPVYDANGFTGTYDEFTPTMESLQTPEGNIMVGLAYMRECIDKCDSLLTGTFLYNQGPYSLSLACKKYGLDINNYKGDQNFMKAHDLIIQYFADINSEKGRKGTHGDPNYIENLASYLTLDERGTKTISYYSGSEKIEIAINNTLSYNSDLTR